MKWGWWWSTSKPNCRWLFLCFRSIICKRSIAIISNWKCCLIRSRKTQIWRWSSYSNWMRC